MLDGISVVICTYNGEKYIGEQISSILKQTVKPQEIILCDDCSTDSTVQLAELILQESGIDYCLIRNESNIGFARNFEKAIGYAKQNYIALSDQDDVWLPEKLEILFRHMKELEEKINPDVPLLVFSDVSVVDQDLRVVHSSFSQMHKMNTNQTVSNLHALCVQNVVVGMSMLANKSLIEKAMPFPKHVINHDWWLALIACSVGRIYFEPKPLVLYRQHGENCIGAMFYHDLIWSHIIRTKLVNFNFKKILNYINRVFKYEVTIRYRNHVLKRADQIQDLYDYVGMKDLLELSSKLRKGGVLAIYYCIRKEAWPPSWQRKAFFLFSLLFEGTSHE